jgi:hypothetical protein
MFVREDIAKDKQSLFRKIKGLNEAILSSCNTQGLLERGVSIGSLTLIRYDLN